VGTISVIDKLTALVAQTLSLSLPFAALRFLPAALRESPEAMDLLYRRMRTVLLALIVPATVVCVALSMGTPGIWGTALVTHQRAVTLALAGLPVIGLVPFLTNAYAGGMSHGRSMRFSVAHSGVLLLAAIAAGVGLGLDGYYGLYAILGTVLVFVAARSVSPRAPSVRPPLTLGQAFHLPAAVWRAAGALLALTFAAPYAALFVQYTSLRLYGAVASGILQSAIGISLSVRALLGTAHAVFLTPHVNRQAEPEARMAWANEFQRNTVHLFIVALPPLLLFADVALRVMYSGKFVAASSFAALFIAAEVITLLSGTYQALIVAGDRMLFHVLQNLAAQALLAGIAALALPRIGLAGAGLAALAAPIFLFGTTLLFLRRRYAIHVSPDAGRMALLTAAILLVCGAVGSWYPGVAIGVMGAKAAICAVTWVVAFYVMPVEDRSRLQAGFARLKKEIVMRIASGGNQG
jgi:O-antigen/teichoic acid export membrane protein